MKPMFIRNVVCAAMGMAWAPLSAAFPSAAVPYASGAACPDAEVVFARGTDEPPGVGAVGQRFADTLRARVAPKSVGVYAINYPASDNWPTGVDGIRDAGAHVVSMAAACPATRMVLGGYSQGAAVAGFVTSAAVPDDIDPLTVPKPLQPEVADHVAAVVLFGAPNARAMNFLGEPPLVVGPLYAGKTIELCVPDDPVCSNGMEFVAHTIAAYTTDSMIDQGVNFAAGRI